MASATVTSKGQITIPAEVRAKLGIEKGDRVEFVRNEKTGRYEIFAANLSIQSLKGILRGRGKPLSIREMNEAIARSGAAAGE